MAAAVSFLPPPVRLPAIATDTSPSSARLAVTASDARVVTAAPALDARLPPTSEEEDRVCAFWDYQFLFISQRAETLEPAVLRVVDGAVPVDLPAGTYYLAGPGMFADDHGSTVHPLDGHGYLRAFAVGGGEVRFSARYVETAARVEEHDRRSGRWRFTHRGPFSVLRGGRKLGNTKVMKNVANTSVVKWGAHLLCLWEGGDPYEIVPWTLETVGLFDMISGQDECDPTTGPSDWSRFAVDVAAWLLKPILHGVFKMPPKRMLSHYKIDACRGRLLVVCCNAEDMLLPCSNFTFYEFDVNFKLMAKKEFSIPDHFMIHDWAFTDTHYIIFGNRIKLDIPGSVMAVSGLSPMISALSVNPSQPTSPIYLLPRFSGNGDRDWRVPIEAPSQLWLLHVGNAYEKRDKAGNLDIQMYATACSYQWFNFQKMFGYDWQRGKLDPSFMNPINGREGLLPHLVQVSMKLNREGDCKQCFVNPLHQLDKPSDFPVINQNFSGTQNKHIYVSTSSGSCRSLPHFPFNSLAKIDIEDRSVSFWSTLHRRFIGEPIFVPKGVDEDDGYLLLVEYAVSIQRCYLIMLDSKRIGKSDALVARLEVPKHLNFPLGFHGFWAPAKS